AALRRPARFRRGRLVDALAADVPVTVAAQTAVAAVEGTLGVLVFHQVIAQPGSRRTTIAAGITHRLEVPGTAQLTPEHRNVGGVVYRQGVERRRGDGVAAAGHQEHGAALVALGRAAMAQTQSIGLEGGGDGHSAVLAGHDAAATTLRVAGSGDAVDVQFAGESAGAAPVLGNQVIQAG